MLFPVIIAKAAAAAMAISAATKYLKKPTTTNQLARPT